MTIERGQPWGRSVPRPDDLVVVDDDHALAAALSAVDRSHPPTSVRGGDLARTLGVVSDRTTLNELPIDLLEVRLDGATESHTACAHVIARSPWMRGGWWRGPVLAVMNAEFLGEFDVAPRGHPNDGRVETFEADASMSIRQRLAARRRLRNATHVPHPSVTTRSVRDATWTFQRSLEVFVDGRHVGRATTIAVTVVADAAVVYA